MRDLAVFTLLSFSAIFLVVDAPGVLPIFVAITARDSEEKRRSMARRACLAAFGILAVFALGGGLVFRLLGIGLAAFKVAGGILLLLVAIDMLLARPSRTRSSPPETGEAAEKEDVAIVPLAIPLLAGPGAIATVMVVTSRARTPLHLGLVVACAAVTMVLSYYMLRAASWLERALGHSGLAIFQRVMGLLLAAIAVQFMMDGLGEWLAGALAARKPG